MSDSTPICEVRGVYKTFVLQGPWPWSPRQDVQAVIDAPSIVVTRERKGKPVTDEIRPQVLALDVVHRFDGDTYLVAELGTQPRALRPSELLDAAEPALQAVRVRRTHQFMMCDGARSEPLPLGATSATHAEVCA